MSAGTDLAVTGNGTGAAGGRVMFGSQGETIAGRLVPAAFGAGPAAAVAIIGPMTFQKDQAPTLYAQRLSQLGYTALVFDPRFPTRRRWHHIGHQVPTTARCGR
jgi:hypothetical protein